MKIYVEHDQLGNIRSITTTNAPPGFRSGRQPNPAYQMTELDVPELVGKPGDRKFDEKIKEIKESFIVKVGSASLVRKHT